MSSKIVAIGPKDVISCFASIGAELRVTKDSRELSAAIENASRQTDLALVLVPEPNAVECRGAIKAFRAESQAVMLLLPTSAGGPDLAIEEIGKEIEKAVGMNLLKTESSSNP
ncbi:MAG: V-type ATP synthase subunit F [Planctomycetota bacterium]